jgi:hypothetical protein
MQWRYLPPTGLCIGMMLCKVQHKLSSSSSSPMCIRSENSGCDGIMTMMHTKGFMRELAEKRERRYLQSLQFWFLVHIYHTLHNVVTASWTVFYLYMFVPHFPLIHAFFLWKLKSAFSRTP